MMLVGSAQQRRVIDCRKHLARSGQGCPRRWLPGHFTKHQLIHCVKSAGRSLRRRPPLTLSGRDLTAETPCGGAKAPEAMASSSCSASAQHGERNLLVAKVRRRFVEWEAEGVPGAQLRLQPAALISGAVARPADAIHRPSKQDFGGGGTPAHEDAANRYPRRMPKAPL